MHSSGRLSSISLALLFFSNLSSFSFSSDARAAAPTSLSISSTLPQIPGRGGGGVSTRRNQKNTDDLESNPFSLLADAIQPSLHDPTSTFQHPTLKSIAESLSILSKSQAALKQIDGASHEFYQRSHSLETSAKTEVHGRAARSAGRIGCCADALFACELVDLITNKHTLQNIISNDIGEKEIEETTLNLAGGREILLNVTLSSTSIPLHVLVLYESEYAGGSGIRHGGIDGLLSLPVSSRPKGRIFIVVRDGYEADLSKTLEQLDHAPEFLHLREGLVAQEVACVNGVLWRCAEELLEVLQPILMNKSNITNGMTVEGSSDIEKDETPLPAIHFVATSLAGGVVSLAAAILNGSIPMPVKKRTRKRKGAHRREVGQHESNEIVSPSTPQKPKRRKKHKRHRHQHADNQEESTSNAFVQEVKDRETSKISPTCLEGFAKGRTSAVVLGAPPSLSSNVETPFITSVIHGDDIVCRTTKDSLDKLRKRTISVLKKNPLAKRVGWMKDTISLAVSGIQTHAHGSEGEEARLSLAGKVYLVRPRRISGGVSSMHEIGAAGGREALRAAVLWSLRDVLLSKSLWAHHSFEAYIAGLDKVQLRKFRSE